MTNIDKTTHAGLEALVGSSVMVGGAHRIEPQVSVTLNQFHFDDNPVYRTNRLPAAPPYAARGEVLYRRAGGFYAGPTFDFIGKRYVDFANSYTVDGYGLMGLRAGFSGRRWEVFGEVRNMFDTDYIATVSVRMWPPPTRECSIRAPRCRLTPAGGIRSSQKGRCESVT